MNLLATLLILAALGPQPMLPRALRQDIPAPVLVSLTTYFQNKHVELSWTHPTAHWFVIQSVSNNTTNLLSCKFNDKLDTFSLKVKFDGATSYCVAASEQGKQSKWSNTISVQPAAEP